MPAKSKAQQKAAGAALSAKHGETKKSDLKGASREMVDSMSEEQLEDFARHQAQGQARAREEEVKKIAGRMILPTPHRFFRSLLRTGSARD